MSQAPELVRLMIGMATTTPVEAEEEAALGPLGRWRSIVAEDGAQAIRALTALAPAPEVVLAQQAPGAALDPDAWVSLLLAAQSAHPHCAIIIRTWASPLANPAAATQRLLHAGAFGCLATPHSPAELAGHVAAAISAARRRHSLTQLARQAQAATRVIEVAEAALACLKSIVDWHKATIVLIGEQRPADTQRPVLHIRSLLYYKGYSYREISRELLIPVEEDSLIQKVVAQARPFVLPDLAHAAPTYWKRQPQTVDVCSWIGLPLQYGERVVGLITLDHQTPNHYQEVDLVALQEVADITAAAIDTTLRRRNLEAVRRVMRAISSQHQVEALLQRILGVIQTELNSSRCTYFRRAEYSVGHANKTRLELWMDERDIQLGRDQFMLEEGQGVAGWVLQHGRSANIQNTRDEPRFVRRDEARWKDPTSLMAVPVRVGDRTIGVICVDKGRESYFSPYDLELVEILSEQVATVIERTWTLGLLSTTSTAINKLSQKREVLLGILEHAMRLTNATSGTIRRVQRTPQQTWQISESYSAPPEFEHPMPRLEENSLTLQVINTRQTVQLAPAFGNTRHMHPDLQTRGVRAVIGTPLQLDDDVIGVISLNSPTKDSFNDVEEFSLQLFANQAAIAIHKAETLDAVSHQAEAWKKLGEAASAVMSNRDLEATFFAIAEEAVELVNGKYSHLARVNRRNGKQQIEFVAAYPRENRLRLQQRVGPIDLETGSAHWEGRLGVTGLAVRNARAYLIRDVLLEIDDIAYPDTDVILHYIRYQTDTRSEIAVPILDEDDQVIGVINIEHPEANALTADHVEVLKLFAAQAAIAIQKDSLLSLKMRREQQLASLAEVTQAIIAAQPDKLLPTLQQAVLRIREGLDVMDVIVVRMQQTDEADPQSVSPLHMFSCRVYRTDLAVRPSGPSISRTVYITGQRREIADASLDDSVNPHMREAGVRAALCLPLNSRGGRMGVMWLHFAEPRLTDYEPQELELFQLYADQIAVAYEVVEQVHRDRAQAEQDRKLLINQRDEITKDLGKDYTETRNQARTYYALSITSSIVGLVFCLGGLSGLVSGTWTGVTVGTAATLFGIVSQIFGYFVFSRADAANRRMDQYHNESLQFRQLNMLIDYAGLLTDPGEQLRQRQAIMNAVVQRWFAAQPVTPGASVDGGPAQVPPVTAP